MTRRKLFVQVLCGLVLHSLITPPEAAAATSEKKKKAIKPEEIFRRASPTLAVIEAFDDPRSRLRAGIGVLVGSDGRMVTNYHVITGARQVRIHLGSGDVYDSADIIELDQRRDIAILKIKAIQMPVVPVGDSDAVKPGDLVYRFTFRGGQKNLQTGNVVNIRQTNGFRAIEMEFPDGQANAAGPIFDVTGAVIGISLGSVQKNWLALPVNYARALLESKNLVSFSAYYDAYKKVEASQSSAQGAVGTQPPMGPATGAAAGVRPMAGIPGGVPGGSLGAVIGGVVGAVNPPAPPPPAGAAIANPQRIRVGGAVQASRLVQQPKLVYPPLARQARIQGTVKIGVTIGKDGAVKELRLISGHPLLVPSALVAVKQWVYSPTLLNGEPVEVISEVDVNFTLTPPQTEDAAPALAVTSPNPGTEQTSSCSNFAGVWKAAGPQLSTMAVTQEGCELRGSFTAQDGRTYTVTGMADAGSAVLKVNRKDAAGCAASMGGSFALNPDRKLLFRYTVFFEKCGMSRGHTESWEWTQTMSGPRSTTKQ